MASTNLEIVRAIYAAFAVGDIPAVLGAMAPDMVWNEADDFPYADGNPYRGPQAILEGVFMRIGAEWDGFAVEVEELHDAGDTIVATGRYKGSFRATGKAQDTQFAHVWKLRDGKAASFQQYANTLHVARVTGKA